MTKLLLFILVSFYLPVFAANELAILGGADIDLGSVTISQSKTQAYTLSNTGTQKIFFYEFFFDFTKGQLNFDANGDFPGTGTCTGAFIEPGQSCTFVVKFKPTSATTVSANFKINYYYGSSTVVQKLVMKLHGVGVNTPPPPTPVAAALTISDGPVYDYGTVAFGAQVSKTFFVTNSGGSTAFKIVAGGISAPFTFEGGVYPGTQGNCADKLLAGASCVIVVDFMAGPLGAYSDSIEIKYFNGETDTLATRALQATSVSQAHLVIEPKTNGTLSFGSLVLGSSKTMKFTIVNDGNTTANQMNLTALSSPFLFTGGSYPGTGGTCGVILVAMGSCEIMIDFSPNNVGTFSDKIEVAYYDGAVSQVTSREINGTSLPVPLKPAVLTISDGPIYDFGAVVNKSKMTKAFTVTNSGESTASQLIGFGLVNPFQFNGGSFPGVGGNCSVSLASGAHCIVVVEFSPNQIGAFSDVIQITYFNGFSSTETNRDVQGTSLKPAHVVIEPQSTLIDFGSLIQGQNALKTITVSNDGDVSATQLNPDALVSPYSFLGGSFPGTGGTCGDTLAPSSSCVLIVQFAPPSVGVFKNTISLNYFNGSSQAQAQKDVSGEGLAIPLSPANLIFSEGASYDYGTVTAPLVATHVFTITNTGESTAVKMNSLPLGSPFYFKGGTYPGLGGTCLNELKGANSCTVVVEFLSGVAGAFNGVLSVSYFDGKSSAQVDINLQAEALKPLRPAVLVMDHQPALDFGAVTVGGSRDAVVRVVNQGEMEATQMREVSLASPFSFKGGSYPGVGGTCGRTLAVQDQCTVVLVYGPLAQGSFNDALEISYNDGQSAQQANLSLMGTGNTTALLVMSDDPQYNFGSILVGQGEITHAFTVTNIGGTTASGITNVNLSAPFLYVGGTYPGSGGTCSATLAPGQSCSLNVSFSPRITGQFNDELVLHYFDGILDMETIRRLSGRGLAPALLQFVGAASFDYGTVIFGSEKVQTFTLVNSGEVAATGITASSLLAPFRFTGGKPFPGDVGTCSDFLLPGKTCTLNVTFTPKAVGKFSDKIKIRYLNGMTSQATEKNIRGAGFKKK